MPLSPQFPKLHRIIVAGSIVAITATGALYGAGLKTGRDNKKAVTTVREATPAEQLAMLETTRLSLVEKRIGLERKIEELVRRRTGAEPEAGSQGLGKEKR